jgi:hypothetical protein
MKTHCLRPILLGGVMLLATACTTAEDRQMWQDHSTQYASDRHMAFSARNVGAKKLRVTETDLAYAQREQWWGRGLPGSLSGGPPAEIGGRWEGVWSGRGMFSNTARSAVARAEFVLKDDRGEGVLVVYDAGAVEGVPWTLRRAGSVGVLVWVKVDGNDVYIQEATDKRPFSAEFTVQGDKMVGHFLNSTLPIQIELARRP